MISMTFAGLPISCWQEPKIGYTITKNEKILLTGDKHVSLSTKQMSFPRLYLCYTENFTDISNLIGQIGSFDTLTISGTSFYNCYISRLDSIFEIVRGKGKWTYEIEFSQADQH